MAFKDALLPEFDNEMRLTRRLLERTPEGKNDWAPHEKSMKLWRLAGHLAELPGWGATTFEVDSFDVNPPGGSSYKPEPAKSTKELLEIFDKNVARARAVIEKQPDSEFMKPWSLLNGGQTVFTMPKAAVLRSFFFSHIIHHRGQYSVYLRLLNIPVPSIYGPSADEQPF